ncbi:HTH-type transcriptional activator AllS [Chromobacterium violaceum]|uniref:HTH-type transcriptional activator AllS n=1 Tax=Chromobacterium violaceum TaxID=536 RepID=A0A3S4JTM9_CHRVL|nr:HTH-type transcriptional activator AllS [Chromobacterium violaceum]
MKTMPSPDNLLAFDALARAGSFTAAADLLDCHKSLVSARVKELEREMGAALVLRTTRRVALTEAGERLRPTPPGCARRCPRRGWRWTKRKATSKAR